MYVSFSSGRAPPQLWSEDQLHDAAHSPRRAAVMSQLLYAARQVSSEAPDALGYVVTREGYYYGNVGDPRDRFSEIEGPLPRLDESVFQPLADGDVATTQWFAFFDPPLNLLALFPDPPRSRDWGKDWDED